MTKSIYQLSVHGQTCYQTQSQSYGDAVTLYGATKSGDTPMSLLVVALASCVTMCVQGYFAKYKHQLHVAIETSSEYQEDHFDLAIRIDSPIDTTLETALLTYIEENCRVKHLLRQDLKYKIRFIR